MRNLVLSAIGAGICTLILAAASLAAAQKTVWTAALSSGQEVPKQVVKNTAGHGLFKGTVSGGKLKWRLTFAKLTGPAMAAHIHTGAKGKSGNVLIALCAPCHSGVSGTATLSATALNDFKKHLLYVNVHTAKNPAGEIRGQLARG
jgi:CHRD domain